MIQNKKKFIYWLQFMSWTTLICPCKKNDHLWRQIPSSSTGWLLALGIQRQLKHMWRSCRHRLLNWSRNLKLWLQKNLVWIALLAVMMISNFILAFHHILLFVHFTHIVVLLPLFSRLLLLAGFTVLFFTDFEIWTEKCFLGGFLKAGLGIKGNNTGMSVQPSFFHAKNKFYVLYLVQSPSFL